MENFFSRYKNPLVLMAVLLIQVVALATQVRRPERGRTSGSGGTRLIRVWTMTAFTPFERALVATGHFFRNTWHSYIDLHDVRLQNRELQEEVARLHLEQVRLRAEAGESRRLRALLDFKERYVGQTVAAQVIGTSGSDLLHTITIDKGSLAGVKLDMPVITPDGIVGKVKDVSPLSAQVLMVNDRESGAGVILQNSRLQGILRGAGLSGLQVGDIMSDEKVNVGDQVVTSGGDGVYPKGLPVGAVTKVAGDSEGGPFLVVTIKPAANLDRLEEVLVVTKIAEESPAPASDSTPQRAAEILARRLPSVPQTANNTANQPGQSPHAGPALGSTSATGKKPGGQPASGAKTAPKAGIGTIPAEGAPALVHKTQGAVKPSPSPTPGGNVRRDEALPKQPGGKTAQPPAAATPETEKPPR